MSDLGLPPAIDHPLVKKAAQEYERLRAEHHAEQSLAHALTQQRHVAVEQDRAAYAEALRAKKEDQGRPRRIPFRGRSQRRSDARKRSA